MRFAVLLLLCAAAPGAPLRYWVEPCARPETECRAGDPELAEWAMEAWQAASGGLLTLEKTDRMERAQIRIHWAGPREGMYGEAHPIEVDGKRGAALYIRPAIVPRDVTDPLLRDSIIYLSCVHETGHALGLPHTAAFDDIMYSFQFGGDLREYFARYRRKIAARAEIRKRSGMSDEDRSRLRAILREAIP